MGPGDSHSIWFAGSFRSTSGVRARRGRTSSWFERPVAAYTTMVSTTIIARHRPKPSAKSRRLALAVSVPRSRRNPSDEGRIHPTVGAGAEPATPSSSTRVRSSCLSVSFVDELMQPLLSRHEFGMAQTVPRMRRRAAIAVSSAVGSVWRYLPVVAMLLWPSRSLTT